MPVEILKSIIRSGDAPIGTVIYGPPGTGKTTLAHLFAKGLLCENFLEDVCGECESCLLLADYFSGSFWHMKSMTAPGLTGNSLKKYLISLITVL